MDKNIQEAINIPFSEIFNTKKEEKTFLEKGIDCLQICDYEEALLFLDKAINLDSSCAVAWEKKAIALQKLGLINEAINVNNIAIYIYDFLNKCILKKKK